MKIRIVTVGVFFIVSHLFLAAAAMGASEAEKAEILAPFLGSGDASFALEGMPKPEEMKAAFEACRNNGELGCVSKQLEAKGFKVPPVPKEISEHHAKAQACANGAKEEMEQCFKNIGPIAAMAAPGGKLDVAANAATSAQ